MITDNHENDQIDQVLAGSTFIKDGMVHGSIRDGKLRCSNMLAETMKGHPGVFEMLHTVIDPMFPYPLSTGMQQ